jgi:transcriptional regulator with XRE-family HTH domain
MDWNKIVSEIKETGMTQSEIADHIEVSAGTLSELCSGKVVEPKWSKGDALLKLHEERCLSKRAA